MRRVGVMVQLAQFFGDGLQGFDLFHCQAVGGNVGRVGDAQKIIAGDAEEHGQADQDVVGRQVDAVFIGADNGLGNAEPLRQVNLGHAPLNSQFSYVFTDDRINHG